MGWEVVSASAPVQFVKKRPLVAAGIVGGAILLVYLIKPAKEEPAAGVQESTYTETGLTSYPAVDESGGGAGMSSPDYSAITGMMDQLQTNLAEQLEGQQNWVTGQLEEYASSNQESMNSLADWAANSMEKFSSQMETTLTSRMNELVTTNQVIQPAGAPDITQEQDIQTRMARNSALANSYFNESGTWEDPRINPLHQENLELAAELGGVYHPSTGTYSYPNQTPARTTVESVAPRTPTVNRTSIESQMAANSARANQIYQTSKNWNDPGIVALHNQNLQLAGQIGKTYDSATGTYH